MAALALVGAMMSGCSSEDIIDNPQQPENKDNVVTLTTTVSLDGGNATRALDPTTRAKKFAVDDQIAVMYSNVSPDVSADVIAVSNKLTSSNISADGKTATFTVTLVNPNKEDEVAYMYPASMILDSCLPNYNALYSQQDGTLATLGSKFDYCTKTGSWNNGELPTLTLENRLAILAITLKDASSGSEITDKITGLTVSVGTYTYNVSRTAAAGPIYVAIRPATTETVSVLATDGTNYYAKTLSTKQTYAQGNGYNVTWRMAENTLAKAIAADKGKLICTDGHIHAYGADAGCTKDRVAMIAYVGSDACEAGDAPYNHGLALALTDANNGNYAVWCSQRADNCLMSQYDGSTMTNDMAGIANTDVLVGTSPHNHGDNAAKAARNYKYVATADAGAHPTGTSAWFLPSAGQWAKMATAAGGYIALRDGFSSVGGTKMRKEFYWSSTERNAILAWFYNFEDDYNHPDGHWHIDGKDITVNFYVRACLAF